MDNYMYLVPVAAVVALLFAAYLANKVSKMDAGTDRMKEIADAIAEGARAFLGAEYKILVIFVAVLFVLIGVGIQNWIEEQTRIAKEIQYELNAIEREERDIDFGKIRKLAYEADVYEALIQESQRQIRTLQEEA